LVGVCQGHVVHEHYRAGRKRDDKHALTPLIENGHSYRQRHQMPNEIGDEGEVKCLGLSSCSIRRSNSRLSGTGRCRQLGCSASVCSRGRSSYL
jgi:hypothetical protein